MAGELTDIVATRLSPPHAAYSTCCIRENGESFAIESFVLSTADGSQQELVPLPPPPYVPAEHISRFGASFAPDGARIVYVHAGRAIDGSETGVAVASLDGLAETRLGPAGAFPPAGLGMGAGSPTWPGRATGELSGSEKAAPG